MDNPALFQIVTTCFYVVFCLIAVSPIVLIIIALVVKNRRDRKLQDKMLAIKQKQLHLQETEHNANRIVTCECCKRQSRFGNGICNSCGALLTYQ